MTWFWRTWVGRIIRNIQKRGLKDVTNPNKMKAFTEGEVIKKSGLHLEYNEIQSYCEQVVYRMYFCECAGMDHCPHCTCQQPISFFCRNFECSQDNYEHMYDPQEWEDFKKEHEIQLIVKSKYDND